jgi:hypothetical protein
MGKRKEIANIRSYFNNNNNGVPTTKTPTPIMDWIEANKNTVKKENRLKSII